MRISVVVPFFNAEHTLEKCLSSLAAQVRPADEIILVDNGSGDRSPEIAAGFVEAGRLERTRIVREEEKGPSPARNRGAREASGDVLAFIDSDCVADADWLEELSKHFDTPETSVVAGHISGYAPRNAIQKFLSLFTLRTAQHDSRHSSFDLLSGGFPTANLAMRQDLFVELEGFGSDWDVAGEDYDLCARIYGRGHQIQYTTSARVRHIHRSGFKGLIRQSYGFGWGHAALLAAHFRRMVILELPGVTVQSRRWPLRLWGNLISAEKKLLISAAPALFFWPLFVLPVLYWAYLQNGIARDLKRSRLESTFAERWQLTALLILKSSAMTAGRLMGAWRFGVVCF